MGYTSGHDPMFSSDMPQTPENVAKVLDIAGWTPVEAAKEIFISYMLIADVLNGRTNLPNDKWRLLLDLAGRRAFDQGCDI